MITDGGPTDGDNGKFESACAKIASAEQAKEVAFFAIGVAGADMTRLKQLSVREPLPLNGLNFNELFLWLSASMKSVSNSATTDQVALPSPAGWTSI